MADNSKPGRWDWLLPQVLVRASKQRQKTDDNIVHQSDDEESTRKSKKGSWYSWYGMLARDNGSPATDKATTTTTTTTPETAGKRKRDTESTTAETLAYRKPIKHSSFPPPSQAPSREEIKAVYNMCRQNKWELVLESIRSNPLISTTILIAKNNLSTSILHQAISSKGDTKERVRVIQEVLRVSTLAAFMKNNCGSLPIHCISQRNTKMDFKTKERLIRDLMNAYPESLTQQTRTGMRTPLHIIMTGTFCLFVICI